MQYMAGRGSGVYAYNGLLYAWLDGVPVHIGPQMNVQDLIDDPMVEKHIFLDFDGNIVCRFEHPEFIFEMTQEA